MLDIQTHIITAPYTSWLIGGPADYFCLPETIEQLTYAQNWAQQKKMDITVLGSGSNVLISDKGIRGLTICLKKLSLIEAPQIRTISSSSSSGEVLEIIALAGAKKSELLKIFLKNKLAPALFLAGIPGDIGGGVVMNAGVSELLEPREFGEIVSWIEVLKPNGNLQKYSHDEISWSYRSTKNWQPGIVVRVCIQWPNLSNDKIIESVRDANRIRSLRQPLDKPSCGSVFKNPLPHRAAQLIEASGLKGYQEGEAQVSLKHANFVVNLNQATAKDTWSVIQHVKKVIFEKYQIDLHTEVVRLGEWS